MTGPPTGWRVEIDLPSGETIVPTVAAEPTYYHSLNSLPEADIPVRPDNALLTGTVDRVDARVWADGQRLPLDTVTEIEQRRGGGELVLILTVIGGTQLQTRAAREVASKPAHTVVEDLVPHATAEPPRDRREHPERQYHVPKPRGPRRAELVKGIAGRHYIRQTTRETLKGTYKDGI